MPSNKAKKPTPTRALSLRIPRELYERIEKLAEEERRTVSNLIFKLLEEDLDAAEKPATPKLRTQRTHRKPNGERGER